MILYLPFHISFVRLFFCLPHPLVLGCRNSLSVRGNNPMVPVLLLSQTCSSLLNKRRAFPFKFHYRAYNKYRSRKVCRRTLGACDSPKAQKVALCLALERREEPNHISLSFIFCTRYE
ncbi:hypothetical protein QBC44DRAFT_324189 [Cladorrhinum sp. PSN332]|nr:hypothetical protein QBC44DRAFT_324189 [Cladorrhinum sp. PSN332]